MAGAFRPLLPRSPDEGRLVERAGPVTKTFLEAKTNMLLTARMIDPIGGRLGYRSD